MHLSTIIKIGLLLLTTANCYATVQYRDPLTFEGKEGYIEEKPVWPILENRNLKFEIQSTGNYSGFYSSWTIESNHLYLVSFSGRVKGQGPFGLLTKDVDLKWLFPESEGKVLANWFTGNIRLNLGDERLRAMGGHITATDTLVVFHVNKGMIEKKETYLYPDNIDVINKRESETFGEPIDIRKMIK
jgi:hypothetical protein